MPKALFAIRKGPSPSSVVCPGGPCPMKAGCPRSVPGLVRIQPITKGQPRPEADFPADLKGTPFDGGIMVHCQWTDLRAFSKGSASLAQALDKPENLVYIDPTPNET